MTNEELIELAREHGANYYFNGKDGLPAVTMSQGVLCAFAAALSAQAAQPVAFPYSKPLEELTPIGFASAVDIQAYAPRMQIGTHLPGVRDVAMFTKDQLKAACNAASQPVSSPTTGGEDEPDAVLAARYRWLRTHPGQIGAMLWPHAPWTQESFGMSQDRFDLCIDEEIAKLPPAPQGKED